MSSRTELEFSIGWEENPQDDAYIEITPREAPIKAVVYEIIRQAVRTASLLSPIPGEDPTTLMSDEEIEERFLNYDSDVFFQEGGTVVRAKFFLVPLQVEGMGEILDVVRDDELKLSIKLVDGRLMFNRRVFDANYGNGSSEHVMRTTIMGLSLNAPRKWI